LGWISLSCAKEIRTRREMREKRKMEGMKGNEGFYFSKKKN
jgi:hypothetical protein